MNTCSLAEHTHKHTQTHTRKHTQSVSSKKKVGIANKTHHKSKIQFLTHSSANEAAFTKIERWDIEIEPKKR